MATVDTSKMRPGMRVELDPGEPYVITQYQHVKPGKGGAFVRLKLKSLISGSVIDRTLRGGESLPLANVETRSMQYLYRDRDGGQLVFMDKESYEQLEVPEASIENRDLIPESCEVDVLLHNDAPIGVRLPNFVVLEVAETDPAEKGSRLKPATLSTGAIIQVPSFIDRGERLKIDTRDRSYVERA